MRYLTVASDPSEPHRSVLRMRHRGLSLRLAVTVASGLLICLIGVLSGGLPYLWLRNGIDPLAQSVRGHSLREASWRVLTMWGSMYTVITAQQLRWAAPGGALPTDALAPEAEAAWIRFAYSVMRTEPHVFAAPLVTKAPGGCVRLNVLSRDGARWWQTRQNCTHRWQYTWDNATQTTTGERLGDLPLFSEARAGLYPPFTTVSPEQPFSWTGLYSPSAALGVVMKATVGLFGPDGGFVGQAGVAISMAYLRGFLQRVLDREPSTRGGLMALYEPDGMVVAATHGNASLGARFELLALGDPDLEAAARLLQREHGGLCAEVHREVALPRQYLLDSMRIDSPYPSRVPLQWCALLLSPRENTFQALDQSGTFAVIFVTCTSVGVMLLCGAATFVVTQRIRDLADGMVALSGYDVGQARSAYGGCSVFTELRDQQASYDLLLNAMDAFGKYVPRTLVQALLAGTIKPTLHMDPEYIVVLFMDMENFTSMCEAVAAEVRLVLMWSRAMANVDVCFGTGLFCIRY